jgi:phage tail sheath gpL-like
MTVSCTGVGIVSIALALAASVVVIIVTRSRSVTGVNDIAEIDILAIVTVFFTSRELVKRTCLALKFAGGGSVSL